MKQNSHTATCVFILSVSALAASPATAAEKMQPGLWKMKMTRDVGGQAAPAQEVTQCIKPDQVMQPETMSPGQQKTPNCKMLDLKTEGNKTSFRTVCSGPREIEMVSTITYLSPQHYTSVMRTTGTSGGRPINSTMTIDAQRIGDCPK